MHSSRMRTVCCSGRLSCHAHSLLPCMPPTMHAPCNTCPVPCMPLFAMHAPLCHACTPPCMPPAATHTPCHTCHPCHTYPLPHMPPLPHMSPFTTHVPLCYACCPLPCMPPFATHAPLAMHVPHPLNRITDRCKNITFPQLLLRTVKILYNCNQNVLTVFLTRL